MKRQRLKKTLLEVTITAQRLQKEGKRETAAK